MDFTTIVVGELETNCYILRSGRNGIIIDPGAEAKKIIDAVQHLNITLILATHRHYDHIDALPEVKKACNAKAAIHPFDWQDGFDTKLSHGQIINLDNEPIAVIHTPGHTPGGCCFLINNHLFSGDTLFAGGWGNTSFPGGNETAIFQSIREKLLQLPDCTEVYPGHGPATTIGHERYLY